MCEEVIQIAHPGKKSNNHIWRQTKHKSPCWQPAKTVGDMCKNITEMAVQYSNHMLLTTKQG